MAVNRQGKLPLEVAIAEENDEVAVMLIKHMEASVYVNNNYYSHWDLVRLHITEVLDLELACV